MYSTGRARYGCIGWGLGYNLSGPFVQSHFMSRTRTHQICFVSSGLHSSWASPTLSNTFRPPSQLSLLAHAAASQLSQQKQTIATNTALHIILYSLLFLWFSGFFSLSPSIAFLCSALNNLITKSLKSQILYIRRYYILYKKLFFTFGFLVYLRTCTLPLCTTTSVQRREAVTILWIIQCKGIDMYCCILHASTPFHAGNGLDWSHCSPILLLARHGIPAIRALITLPRTCYMTMHIIMYRDLRSKLITCKSCRAIKVAWKQLGMYSYGGADYSYTNLSKVVFCKSSALSLDCFAWNSLTYADYYTFH